MRLKNGKKSDFAEQVYGHVDVLYTTALRLTRNQADAEDLAHDTCVRALRFREHFQPGTNLRAWLFRLLFNLFIHRYWRQKRYEQMTMSREADDLRERNYATEKLASAERPEEFFFERLFSREVVQALEELPVDFRLVILLVDINEFSYAQAAEILDVPIGTVMSRLYRGRKLLRSVLYRFALENGYIRGQQQEGQVADLEQYRRQREFRS